MCGKAALRGRRDEITLRSQFEIVHFNQRRRLTVKVYDPSRRLRTYHTNFSAWSSLTAIRQGARVPSPARRLWTDHTSFIVCSSLTAVRQGARGPSPSRRLWTYACFTVWSSLTAVRQGARVPSTDIFDLNPLPTPKMFLF